jgi:hypothetical protein
MIVEKKAWDLFAVLVVAQCLEEILAEASATDRL